MCDSPPLLCELCKEGKAARVKEALSIGQDVNIRGPGGNTPLMLSVCYNHPHLTAMLLQLHDLDVNGANCIGWTALHFACAEDDVETLRLLVNHPRMKNISPSSACGSPLMVAVGYGSVGCVREMAGRMEVDLEERDVKGRSLEEVARWGQEAGSWRRRISVCRSRTDGEVLRLLQEARLGKEHKRYYEEFKVMEGLKKVDELEKTGLNDLNESKTKVHPAVKVSKYRTRQ